MARRLWLLFLFNPSRKPQERVPPSQQIPLTSESEVDSVEEAAEAMRRSRPPGACARCKQLKVKCEFETGTIPCKRCTNGGHDCVIPGRNKRGTPLKEHQEVGTQIPEQTTETQQLGEEPSQPPPIPVGQPHDVSLPSVRHSTSTPILPTSKPDQPSPSSSFLDNIDATRPSYVSLPESVSMFYGIPSVQGTPSVLATPSSLAESIARIPSPPCERMQSSQPSLLSQISASEYSAASPPQAPSTGRARYPTYPSSPGVFATIPTPANGLPPPVVSMSRKSSPLQTAALAIVLVLFDFIPRQLYLHFLLRIPSLYFSRVTRIFEDARLSLPDIKRMARARPDQWNNPSDMFWQPSVQTPDQMPLPRSLLQFRSNWEGFIDSLMREWKTFNIISVLLLSAILTMLQIESASHPITRVSALLSLICALMSLLYGCMYIIRFGTMRKMHKASSFAGEAQKDTTSILWNIWVLLAMPAVWLAWYNRSIISFLTCIMSFIWLTGTSQDQDDFAMSSRATLGSRLGLTLVFSLGIIYFVLIVNTFYQYGDPLDREWMRNVNEWMKEAASYPPPPQNLYDAQAAPVIPGTPFLRPESQRNPSYTSFWRVPPVSPFLKSGEGDVPRHFNRLPSFTRLTLKPSAFFKTPHPASSRPAEPLDIMHLRHPDVHVRLGAYDNPNWADAVTPSDFIRFELDVSNAWHGRLALTKPEDGASTDIPVYTLLSPARPENPVPTTESDAGLDAPAHAPARGIHSIASSETSYGPVLEPTRYVTARFSASETPVSRENPIPDGIGVLSTSLAQSLADDIGPGPSRAPQPAETSEVDPAPDPVQTVRELIDLWNRCYFHPRNLEASLVPRPDSSGPAFDVNLAWWSPAHLASEEHFDEKALNPPNDITKTASEPSFAGSFATAEDAHAPVP
ncbi:hypothetical protein MSAN_00741800 [Mycena sanguinolenta]|uniref:Zn(2)-C6 fungal-type domain-containing protein n=1 Tax=Mycena sanguinolenta TaxID=230812 RepID=A0A8H6Z8B9_9AGAR|nr:hypothetical protein MSAN_00741800 [Mycena sanguinolenta]